MRLASGNVNSIRQRLMHVTDWLNVHEPDVLAPQEIKTEASTFPLAGIAATGYRCVLDGQKAYDGVGPAVPGGSGGRGHRHPRLPQVPLQGA